MPRKHRGGVVKSTMTLYSTWNMGSQSNKDSVKKLILRRQTLMWRREHEYVIPQGFAFDLQRKRKRQKQIPAG